MNIIYTNHTRITQIFKHLLRDRTMMSLAYMDHRKFSLFYMMTLPHKHQFNFLLILLIVLLIVLIHVFIYIYIYVFRYVHVHVHILTSTPLFLSPIFTLTINLYLCFSHYLYKNSSGISRVYCTWFPC